MENQDIYDKMMDKEFRQNLINNPREYAKKLGYEIPDETEIKVLKNTKDLFYISLTEFSSTGELDLSQIQAAGPAGTASTAGSASTSFTICGTVSTASSSSTLGSASSHES